MHSKAHQPWDELTPIATAYYNFFPNCSARESAFFIMFGRDPTNKLNMMLHAAGKYFHDDNGLPNLEALKNIYQVVAQQQLMHFLTAEKDTSRNVTTNNQVNLNSKQLTSS